METVTYSLKKGQTDSSEYYRDVKIFTDEVLRKFEGFDAQVIPEFRSFLESGMNINRSDMECVFEFLMLGTFWKVYSRKASRLGKNPQKVLETLVNERNQNEPAKETIDIVRGLLMKPFLLDEDGETPDLTVDNFKKLLAYLKAAGDFGQELKHLEDWKDFLETKNPQTVSEYLKTSLLLVDWFESSGKATVGKYTTNVDKFLDEKHYDHHWKEDVIFCGRREVEYHLNMVGAEIMNRAFKKDFDDRPRKALLLPGCMRISQSICKADETNLGLKCIRCSKNCNVNRLTEMGDEYRFEVYIILHESSAFSKSSKKDRNELGIIGVACIPNLIAGGWKSESFGIPAQCVLLDYSSCQNHWDNEGFPTVINVNHLFKLLDIEQSNELYGEPVSVPMRRRKIVKSDGYEPEN